MKPRNDYARNLLCLTIVFLSLPFLSFSQTIKGVVSDSIGGQPLQGATVAIKGSTVLTSTNADGSYSITPTNALTTKEVIVFSYTGYATTEVRFTGNTNINVQLQSGQNVLNDVVVTALNIKRNPKSLGYSIARLDGSKVNTVQTPSLASALSGKVAGVDVSNIANGVAGSKRVIIRGVSSLTGNNQPLWVIDGITINSSPLGSGDAFGGIDYGDGLAGINPDDIESISVLKGNAAAALYGSRASNGVILVTTKSGKSSKEKMNVEISSSLLADRLVDLTSYQNEYGQSSRVSINQRPVNRADAFGSENWGPRLDGEPTIQFDGVVRPFSAVKDNYKRFFNTGSTITNTLALSGSSNNHNYRISMSDLRNTDIVPNSKFTRTNLNLKTSSKFGKLEADVVLNYIYEKAKNRLYTGGNVSNLFYSLLYLPANINIESLKPDHNPDGSEFTYADFVSNPYFIINREKEEDSKNRMTGSVSLKYDFTKWLYARGRMTRDYFLFKRYRLIPDGVLYTGNLLGELDQRSRENVENNYEFLLGINPVRNGKFYINAFAGGNILWRTVGQQTTSGNTFVVPGVYTFNNLKNKLPSTSQASQKTNSLFGSMELSYDKFLYLTLTGRNDWFSTLPVSNNNLFYPSAALSFIFSDALKLPTWISFGKLRASGAQVSGDTGPGQLDLSYSLEAVQYNSQSLQVIGTNNIPNRNLKPLLSTDIEYGLEMDFISNRIGFDVAYYNRATRDDIVQTAVSTSTGYSSAILNVGRLRNSGIEILLRAAPVRQKNFSWDITATFSKNNSNVISLAEDGIAGAPILLANAKSAQASIKVEEGMAYGGIYGFTYMRDASGRKVFDNKGLPMYNSKQVFLGSGIYDKLFGLTNTFNYKDFSLYFLLDGKFGANIYSETNASAVSNGKHKITLKGREDGIIGDGVNQSGTENSVRVSAADINTYYKQLSRIAEEFIYDASFIKLREVSLGYKFPEPFFNRMRINNASVSMVARNLLTVYKNAENVDPESSVASGNAQGLERMVYPATRNIGLTLKLGL